MADVESRCQSNIADEASEGDIEELTIETLQAELEEQRQKADEHLSHLQRMQAEFNNYRRRMAQEKLQAAGRGKEELLSSLLPVLNNLRLALQHADQDPKAVRQGVQMIWQQCEDFLRSQGVEMIPTVGHPFDPMKHEALSIAPATDETPANTMVAEINAGYILNGQLCALRRSWFLRLRVMKYRNRDRRFRGGAGQARDNKSEPSASAGDHPSS